jgi:transposase InsO family protein
MPWAKFITAHLGVLVGMDCFTVEVVTWLGLVRYHVLFAIDIASRKVEILGAAVNPGGAWMEQIARNLVDVVDGLLLGKRYVLTDRDPLHRGGFRDILRWGGVKVLKLPAQSPNPNAFAERFVLSLRAGCLHRIVPVGEAHLRRAISEYVTHHHRERNHQGLENRLIAPEGTQDRHGGVVRRERLGGLLSFYHRDAACTGSVHGRR